MAVRLGFDRQDLNPRHREAKPRALPLHQFAAHRIIINTMSQLYGFLYSNETFLLKLSPLQTFKLKFQLKSA